jgi:hypothetical protein
MVVPVYVALRQSLLTGMRVVKRLCSRVRIFDSLDSTASEPALVQDYVSEDWARGPLELPALPTLQLLCHLVWTRYFI